MRGPRPGPCPVTPPRARTGSVQRILKCYCRGQGAKVRKKGDSIILDLTSEEEERDFDEDGEGSLNWWQGRGLRVETIAADPAAHVTAEGRLVLSGLSTSGIRCTDPVLSHVNAMVQGWVHDDGCGREDLGRPGCGLAGERAECGEIQRGQGLQAEQVVDVVGSNAQGPSGKRRADLPRKHPRAVCGWLAWCGPGARLRSMDLTAAWDLEVFGIRVLVPARI